MHPTVSNGPGNKREQLRSVHALELLQQPPHAACSMERRHSDGACSEQCQHQLHQIRHHNGPQPPSHGVRQHHQRHQSQQPKGVGHAERRRAAGDDAQRLHHLAQCQEGIADTDAVHRQSQQKRFDPTQPGCGRTAVTQFGEGRISQHTAAAPQWREHHRHGHVGQAKAPPLPVPCQTAAADQTRDVEGRIDGERRCGHGRTGKPATQTTACNEIVLLTAVATGQPQPQHQRQNQVGPEKSPVDRCHSLEWMVAVSPREGSSAPLTLTS